MNNKNPLYSKTYWVGVITAIAPIIPVVGDQITDKIAISIIGVAMIILRYFTKKSARLNP